MNTTVENTMIKPAGQDFTAPTGGNANTTLREYVAHVIRNYFNQLAGQPPANLYEMVMGEVEPGLLEEVMRYTKGNQSQAAIILGISRGTLRKKLKIYDVD